MSRPARRLIRSRAISAMPGLGAEQEDADIRIVRMMPPIGRHDVGARRLLLDRAAEEAQAPIDIFAVGRDEGRIAIGCREIGVALQANRDGPGLSVKRMPSSSSSTISCTVRLSTQALRILERCQRRSPALRRLDVARHQRPKTRANRDLGDPVAE